jgi:dihydropteroate synthase
MMTTSIQPVRIVGILNTTPNSFYDGGKFMALTQALDRTEKMLSEGADIIEIGGESTGPNAPEVLCDIELNRTIPVIKEILKRWPKTIVSIDTYKARVAAQAIDAGAVMVNDVTAGRGDADMFAVLAQYPTVQYVLMYAKDASPRTTLQGTEYPNVVTHVVNFLQQRIAVAEAAGLERAQIIIDPGMGHFVSSHAKYSLQLLRELRKITALGLPVLVSPSRKSFLAGTAQVSVEHRLSATLAASAMAVLNGASYIRTHDVLETVRACALVADMLQA